MPPSLVSPRPLARRPNKPFPRPSDLSFRHLLRLSTANRSYRRHDWLVQAVNQRLGEELARLRVEINVKKSRLANLAEGGQFWFSGLLNFVLFFFFKEQGAAQLSAQAEEAHGILRGWDLTQSGTAAFAPDSNAGRPAVCRRPRRSECCGRPCPTAPFFARQVVGQIARIHLHQRPQSVILAGVHLR